MLLRIQMSVVTELSSEDLVADVALVGTTGLTGQSLSTMFADASSSARLTTVSLFTMLADLASPARLTLLSQSPVFADLASTAKLTTVSLFTMLADLASPARNTGFSQSPVFADLASTARNTLVSPSTMFAFLSVFISPIETILDCIESFDVEVFTDAKLVLGSICEDFDRAYSEMLDADS